MCAFIPPKLALSTVVEHETQYHDELVLVSNFSYTHIECACHAVALRLTEQNDLLGRIEITIESSLMAKKRNMNRRVRANPSICAGKGSKMGKKSLSQNESVNL